MQYPEFGSLLSGSIVNVTPLTAEEFEAAALQPVTKAGVTFEPALLAQLIRDVVDQPGSLPLFQYTLTELFDRRASDTLMTSTYRAMGGVNGALSRRADDLFRELDREQSEAARQIFLRLVAVTGDGERTRRRVRAGEIVSLDADVVAMQQVIERFGQHRFLAFDADPATGAPTIEIAHEALLTAWDQYQIWIDHHEADLRQLASLRAAVDEWNRADENPEYLVTGTRLTEFERWSAISPLTLTATERRFLNDGADRRRSDEEIEIRRQQRENRRLRVALLAVLVGLAAAVVAGGFALVQRNRADDTAAESETRRLGFEAIALVDADRRLALLMASEAYARDPGPSSLSALQQVMLEVGPVLGYVGQPDHRYLAAEFAGTTSLIVAAHAEGVEVYSFETFELVHSIDALVRSDIGAREPTSAPAAAFDVSPDGRWAAVSTRFDGVQVLDVTTGETFALEHDSPASSLVFTHESSRLATGDSSGLVKIWQVGDRSVAKTIEAHSQAVSALVFTPDDSLLVTGSQPSTPDVDLGFAPPVLRLWDPVTGKMQREEWEALVDSPFGPLPASFEKLEIAQADPTILRVGARNNLLTFDLETGARVVDVFLPTDRGDSFVTLTGADLMPDGQLLIGLSDGRIRVVDESGSAIATIDTQLLFPGGVDASPDGALVLGAGSGGVVVAALDGRRLLADSVAAGPASEYLSISARGDLVAQSDLLGGPATVHERDGTAYVPVPIAEVLTISQTEIYAVPGGRTLFAAWRIDPAKEEDFGIRLTLHHAPSGDLLFDGVALGLGWSFSPDGRLHANNRVGTVVVWDLETGEEIAVLPDLTDAHQVRSTSFSADESRLMATTQDGRYRLWDTVTWEPVEIPVDLGTIPIAGFSPDGRYLALVAVDGTITVRDAETFEEIRLLEGATPPDSSAGHLNWSNDGRYLVSRFETVGRLWDVDSGRQIGAPFPNDVGRLPGAATGDVPQLVTAVGDDVWIWKLDVDRWFEIACRAAGRNMSAAEWDAFGPSDASYRATCPQYPIDPS